MPTDHKKMFDYANNVYGAHAARQGRNEATYNISRIRVNGGSTVNGRKVDTAPTARALSIVTQFTAFSDRPHVKVLPKTNSDKEDESTSKIEQFFDGYPRAIATVNMHPLKAYLHTFAEAGIGALLLEFDKDCALAGEFPFFVRYLPPEGLAFQFGARELASVVIREMRDCGSLYAELQERYGQAADYAEKRKEAIPWQLPERFKRTAHENPTSSVEVQQLFTRDEHYLWVGGEHVWTKPLDLKGVPVDIGLCVAIPSDRPEEYAFGLVWQILDMLINEQVTVDKATTAFEFFTFPLERVFYNDGTVKLRQAKPGATDDNVAKIEDVPISANFQALQLLSTIFDTAIGRATLQEVTFGEGASTQSGYQVNLLQQGPMLRVEAHLFDAAMGLARHCSRLLKMIEFYATPEMAKEYGAKGDEEVKRYLSSFSTVAHPPNNPNMKYRSRIVLNKKDVEGYTEVEVSLKPELAQDQNAKAQQVGLLAEKYPPRWLDKYVMEVKSQDELDQMRRDDALMQDPAWQTMQMERWKRDKLANDKDLRNDFVDLMSITIDPKMAMLFNELVDQGGMNPIDAWNIVSQLINGKPPAEVMPPMGQAPVDPMMGQQVPMDPMAQGLDPNMQGIPSQIMPAAEMGAVPMSPDQMMMQGAY
jgi:hypothetical protein